VTSHRFLVPSLSLIISVYKKPQVLRYVLAACARQTFRDFEVIVGDDGSGPDVREVVDEFSRSAPFPVSHLWHEDRGWRKNVMLNRALRSARSGYLVFIDGDCIPSENFLADHWNEREEKRVLFGRRVEMSRRWSEALTVEKIRSGEFDRLGWRELMESFRGEMFRFEDGVRIPGRLIRAIFLRTASGMLGCNFSAARSDLEAINGFDELYDGPGCGEDSDVQYRLSLIGVTGKSLRNLAVQYHVWHQATRTSQACWDRFHQIVMKSDNPRCAAGLVRL
jgi:glycosyltransferase involved in cell wall biosynthesis